MARTTQEIEQSIHEESKKYKNQLDALDKNSSKVAFWTYTKKLIAFVVLILEKLFDQHKTDIHAIIEKTEAGSLDWYLNLCYAYQHGNSLIIDNNRPVYSTIDESKQIIKRATIKETEETKEGAKEVAKEAAAEEEKKTNNPIILLFKVAKEVNGELAKLNAIEQAAFTTYLNRRKIAGTKIKVESHNADKLKLKAEVLLDSILFNDDGTLISDGSNPVLKAIQDHLKNFDFGDTFYLSKLTDSVMNVKGVKDFHIKSAKLNQKTTAITQKVESKAGYITLHQDPESEQNPETKITYVLS